MLTQAKKRNCIQCGQPFVAGDAKHGHPRWICSPACKAARKLLSNNRDRSPRRCHHCSTEFALPAGSRRRFYCSRSCCRSAQKRKDIHKNHRARARRFGVEYEPVNRLKLFQRDGWRCQVCGVSTPRSLIGTFKDTAPELDHRVPLALGGGHTWANVQCACRRCNLKKGGTVIAGQLPLFDKPHG